MHHLLRSLDLVSGRGDLAPVLPLPPAPSPGELAGNHRVWERQEPEMQRHYRSPLSNSETTPGLSWRLIL